MAGGARRSGRGFTLIEIMVVMAILALAAAVAIPYLGHMNGAGLAASARELAAGLRLARSKAVVGTRESVLTIDLEGHSFAVAGDPREHHIPDGISMELTTAKTEMEGDKRGRFRFFPDGSSTGGNVALGSAGRVLRVNVDWLTGRVYITE